MCSVTHSLIVGFESNALLMPGAVGTETRGPVQTMKPRTTTQCELGKHKVSGERGRGFPLGWALMAEEGENAFLIGLPLFS